MASLFNKFEKTINQRMSTVVIYIQDSLSDIKSKFIEIQKNLYLNKITELKNWSQSLGRGKTVKKKMNALENKLKVVEN